MHHRSHNQGVCIQGFASKWGGGLHPGGVCIQGGLHPGESALGRLGRPLPGGRPPLRYMGYYGIQSTSGRYASYWNAFLLRASVFKISLKNTKKYVAQQTITNVVLCSELNCSVKNYILKALFCCLLAVIGCADPPLPRGSWKKRVGDSLTVKCNLTDEEWTITCKGQKWSGVLGNCSKGRKLITNIFKERNICCDMGHVGDVGDIADMPIGRNAIIVEDVEDKTLTSK